MPDVVLSWRIDALAALFVALIVAVSIPVTLYALGHGRHGPSFRGSAILYALFVISMLGVVVAGDAFTFLLAWETMTLASFGLVLSDHRRDEVREAAWAYLVMTHTATAALIVAFVFLAAPSGSLAFADWHPGDLTGGLADLVFVLGLLGFGTKAGIVPLHVWLPRAHPLAPSHVSALMSGLMIKLGIYGLLRLGFEWLGPGPTWWGSLVITLGAASAVLGVLYALMQHDLKRLLAFHSVENIGIILLGLGVALVARTLDATAVITIGLAAALFHTVNHATFKALLFLGAGAVESAAGTRDLEHLGGLARRMPVTAATFLVGSAAISALPPLNGFASEWLTFQSLLALGASAAPAAVSLVPLLAGGALALTGALAVACFVKAFGVTFLALPRGRGAAEAVEAGWPERAAMTTLALACVVLGLAAGPVSAALGALVSPSVRAPRWELAGVGAAAGHLSLPVVAAALVLLVLAAAAGARLVGPVKTRLAETWACGIALQPVHQYTSTAFAKPIRLMFRGIVRPIREIELVHRAGTRAIETVHYRAHIAPIYERYLYRAVTERLVAISHVVRRAQSGSLQLYLAYLVGALLLGLVVAR